MKMFKEFTVRYVWPFLLALSAYFAAIHQIFLIVGVLVITDTITGVYAAVRRGDPITSSKFKRVVVKMFFYQLSVIVAFFVDKIFPDNSQLIVRAVAVAIAVTEVKSFSENMKFITGMDIWASVMGYITTNKGKNP
jgi:phage-related holin